MLALPAEVTMANARQVQQDLLARCRQLQGAEAVRVQAGALTRFDSSVLAVLQNAPAGEEKGLWQRESANRKKAFRPLRYA